jgi:hypothetical protein
MVIQDQQTLAVAAVAVVKAAAVQVELVVLELLF